MSYAMNSPRVKPALLLLLAALALAAAALWPAESDAQCALCRTALEGAGAKTARTMNLGILILLVPPVAIFCSIFAVAYKSRKGGREVDSRQ
jgi:hypothetical protein